MAQAAHDPNRVPTLLGVDSTLFTTPTTAAVDPITHAVLVEGQQVVPTDPTQSNPSTVLSYDGNGDLQYITETIGADQYRTTLTYAARVLTNISAAVKL
jgi:hypothetical protein